MTNDYVTLESRLCRSNETEWLRIPGSSWGYASVCHLLETVV